MNPETFEKKGCGTQLLTAGEPSHSWGVEELAKYCQVQHEAIVSGEKNLTPAYWRLGLALNLARERFGRGQWTKYLTSLNIEKTRASKARAIFRTFDTQEQVIGMAVEEAYGKRHHQQATRRSKLPPEAASTESSPIACVDPMRRELKCLIDGAESVTPNEVQKLLHGIQGLIRRLQKLERHLQRRAKESDRNLLPMTRE